MLADDGPALRYHDAVILNHRGLPQRVYVPELLRGTMVRPTGIRLNGIRDFELLLFAEFVSDASGSKIKTKAADKEP
jgi:hypothetical protein